MTDENNETAVEISPENMELEKERRQELLISEWILRVASLERALKAKGLISQEELDKTFEEVVTEFGEIISQNKE